MNQSIRIVVVALYVMAGTVWAAEASHGKRYTYKGTGKHAQELEVFFPPKHDPAKAKVPGVILFHGGGWQGGDLSRLADACQYLAGRGLVAATANYGMLTREELKQLPRGESRKRVCITDAKSAIRWMKQHAAELGVDPGRIITGGGSAGGHIAVLATTNPDLNDPADSKDIDTRMVAYLLFNPAFEAGDSRDPQVDALKHVTREFAPALVMFGTDDNYKLGWGALHAHLKKLGNTTAELWLAEGQKHSFYHHEPWKAVTLTACDRFLAQHRLLAGSPTLPLPATGEKLIPAP